MLKHYTGITLYETFCKGQGMSEVKDHLQYCDQFMLRKYQIMEFNVTPYIIHVW